MEVRRYRVHTPMRGTYAAGCRCKGFVPIPIGAILVALCDHNKTALYVTVRWNNLELLVFPQDLSERAVECDVRPESAA